MFQRIPASTTGLAAIATCLGVVLATAYARAQSGVTEARCPAGYDLIVTRPSYCMSNSGDIIEPAGVRQSLSCPKGYEWLAHLCFSPATGDVVLASEVNAPATALRADLAGGPK